jgi:biopolymer transport protein ExbB
MGIEPITGPAQGGGTVTVLGQNFRENVIVFFGDERSPEVKVERQGTVLTVKAPPGEGTVDVRVVNPDKQEAKKESAFYYGSGVPAKVFQLRHGLRELEYWIHLGGSIMYPIIFLSFVALTLIIHCLFTISEEHLIPRRLVEDVVEYLANGQWDNAAEYCRKKGCAFGRIVLAGVQKADQPAEVIRETIASAGAREAERLLQKVSWLNSIGVISPMLGLFGTVWGLQLAFQAIAGAGAQHQVLAGAIAVALNTTVAGLFVAIPAFTAYFWFRGKIVRLVGNMEVLAEGMAERIISRKGEEE